MTSKVPDNEEGAALLKVLTAHFHALASARCDDNVLKQYSILLRFLKSRKGKSLDDLLRKEHGIHPSQLLPTISEEELRKASLDDLEKLVNDESTARKDLECIAIQRFSVPRGSMRSFSNRRMLVDKLRTLIGNERTHQTIGAVARGEAKPTSDS